MCTQCTSGYSHVITHVKDKGQLSGISSLLHCGLGMKFGSSSFGNECLYHIEPSCWPEKGD